MAKVIDGGASGATGNASATGTVQVIAAGQFDGAHVQVNIAAEVPLTPQVPVYTFQGPGAVQLQTKSGTTVYAEVVGGGGSVDIDVSIL